jgi:hypothetical protein
MECEVMCLSKIPDPDASGLSLLSILPTLSPIHRKDDGDVEFFARHLHLRYHAVKADYGTNLVEAREERRNQQMSLTLNLRLSQFRMTHRPWTKANSE